MDYACKTKSQTITFIVLIERFFFFFVKLFCKAKHKLNIIFKNCSEKATENVYNFFAKIIFQNFMTPFSFERVEKREHLEEIQFGIIFRNY